MFSPRESKTGATSQAACTKGVVRLGLRNISYLLKEICPRGNNKVVIYISLYHDKCLLFMLELY